MNNDDDYDDNKPHGMGTSFYYSGAVEYKGSWKNGLKHGFGIYYLESGEILY